MMFLYGMLVVITVEIPPLSQFYGCIRFGKVIAYSESSEGGKYLVKYDGCKFPEDSPQSGYDRDWYPASYLKRVK